MCPIFNKDLPIYKQLAGNMKESIIKGEYVGGDKLPSIRESATRNNVSLVTMMNAYQDLESDGFVSNSGNNSYVVTVSSSIYVNDYHYKRIEDLYKELKECCSLAGIDDVFLYLKKIDKKL